MDIVSSFRNPLVWNLNKKPEMQAFLSNLYWHFKRLEGIATYDASKLAPQQKRLWLYKEPTLTGRLSYKSAFIDDFTDQSIRYLYSDCDVALVSYHCPNANSYGYIAPHRDAKFAKQPAVILNLGGPSIFGYSPQRRNIYVENCTQFWLEHGDLLAFNCKHVHYAIPASTQEDRIALVMWSSNPDTQL